jgi:hypothetical protein
MEFRDGRYCLAVFFIYGKEHRDWMASIWRDEEGPWCIEYRFRYYAEDDGKRDSFDGRDRKSWYDLKVPREEPEAELIRKITLVAEELVRGGYNDRYDLVMIRSDRGVDGIKAIAARPWAHVKELVHKGNA